MRQRRGKKTGWGAVRLEMLEAQDVLSGVTLIAHGLGTNANGWVKEMAEAMAGRADLQSVDDFTTYKVTVKDPGHDGGELTVTISKVSGPGPDPTASAKSPEILLLLDWSDVAGTISGGYSRSTKDVGAAVAEKLADPAFLPELGGALAQLPIGLIGHSRGASLVSQIATGLGRRGIWVDQMTTFDPVPIALYGDPVANVPANVIFADNYFQQSDSLAVGVKISGAQNAGPLNLPGGYVNAIGNGYHDNTHLYYHGTIDTEGSASDGSRSVNLAWYNDATRTGAGFYWSRLVGGARPKGGVGSAFGGSGGRASVKQDIASWANVGVITFTSKVADYAPGAAVALNFRYQDAAAASTVTWYFDPDRNPYNGNEVAVGAVDLALAKKVIKKTATLTIPAGLLAGEYHLMARITDGLTTRMDYAQNRLTVSADGAGVTLAAVAPTQAAAGKVSLVGAPGGVKKSALGSIVSSLGKYSSVIGKIGLGNIGNLGSLTTMIPKYLSSVSKVINIFSSWF